MSEQFTVKFRGHGVKFSGLETERTIAVCPSENPTEFASINAAYGAAARAQLTPLEDVIVSEINTQKIST